MSRGTGRVFLFLVAVSLPPLVAFAAADVLGGDMLASLGMGTSLLVASGITVVWAAIVAVGASRVLGGEARRMVELAELGTPATERSDEAAGDAQRRLM